MVTRAEVNKIKRNIESVFKAYGLKRNQDQAKDILLRAILIARDYGARPYYFYSRKPKSRRAMGIGKPVGRKQDQLRRFYIFSAAQRAWSLLTPKKPTLPYRYDPPTLFLQYLEGLLMPEGFRRFIDNWHEYKSFYRACSKGLDYNQWLKTRK
jgi:hypothetical protein